MPKPILQAMVLADHVYRDAGTGKFIIAGTFGVVFEIKYEAIPEAEAPASEITGNRQTFNGAITQAGSPYLYVALSEIHGRVPLRLKYVNLDDSSVLIEGEIEVASDDPVATMEFGFPLPKLPIMPGHFSLDLLHEGEILGSWRVTVKQQNPNGNGA